MTDHDRNVRTLVVCFVLALAVLVPLRLSQKSPLSPVLVRQAEVLGETEVEEVEQMDLIYADEVVLPDAEILEVVETEE